MRGSKTLEFKETVSNTFLKTVSAFANYGTGEIRFGVSDDGTETGIEDPVKTCMDIENRINDSIDPVPGYTLSINEKTSVITLTVSEGLHKPYLYKAKAYRRNDTATIAVDRLELTRLILEGQDLSYEELPAVNQELTFAALEKRLSEVLNIDALSKDILKTLELYNDKDGFNKAGELLSDTNGYNGIDIVRFGENINIILDRETFAHESVLKLYDDALTVYRKYYQYEWIKGSVRETVSTVPEEAFRETVANAIVHRAWDVDAKIQISMFSDRIEVVSPGGLPEGISQEDYFRGGISVLRNRIIGNIFFRLNMIERFGTGIKRIREIYMESDRKPVFVSTENTVRVTLPVMSQRNELSEDDNRVYMLLKGRKASSSYIAEAAGFGKSKTVSILKRLAGEGYIRVLGRGRGTKYTAD